MTYQQHQHPSSAGVALSHEAAQHALTRMRRAWRRFTTITGTVAFSCLGAIPLSLAVGVVSGSDATYPIISGVTTLAFLGVIISGILALVGFQTLRKTDQMERVMSHYPWVERYQYRVQPGAKRVLVAIAADRNGPEATGVATGGFGWPSLDRLQAGVGYQPLLVAGDPRQLAVITTPAMDDLYLLRPSWI